MFLFLPEVIITVIVPIVYIFAAIGFITAYAIYPVIDRYMIAPYRKVTHGAQNDACFDDDALHQA